MMRGASFAVKPLPPRAPRGVRPLRVATALSASSGRRRRRSRRWRCPRSPCRRADHALQPRQRLRLVSCGCSSRRDDDRVALFCAIAHRTGSRVRSSRPLRRHRVLLASAAPCGPAPRARCRTAAATFSAVSGIESTPYCAFISRLTKAPADGGVVDRVAAARRPVRPSAHDEGRRGSCSRRHRRSSAASPARIAPRDQATAINEPRSRLIVCAQHLHRQPGHNADMRDIAVVLAGLAQFGRSRRNTSVTRGR